MARYGNQHIHQVCQRHQTTAIVYGPQRQRNTFVQPLHHIEEIGFHSRAVDQNRTNNSIFHPCLFTHLPQTGFSFELGDPIGIGRSWNIVGLEWTTRGRRLAVHLDRADENETFDPRCCRLPSEIQCSLDIHFSELSQRIESLVIHHMNTSSAMNDGIDACKSVTPKGATLDIPYRNSDSPI
ncbi:hypothetical protein PA13_1001045 [Pseudomonas aeruginosa HB13]|nr:hypothetical protein HW09_31540 [Pseudomonas aeruginosa]ERF08627.1 hypothetical protein PA13_1001045 [Pseudomonas aeruginosa HB13]